jgi:hypothetical protein
LAVAAERGAALAYSPDEDGLRDEDLQTVLREVPRGAFALAGLTTGLLMLAWFALYLFVFLPRGSVG